MEGMFDSWNVRKHSFLYTCVNGNVYIRIPFNTRRNILSSLMSPKSHPQFAPPYTRLTPATAARVYFWITLFLQYTRNQCCVGVWSLHASSIRGEGWSQRILVWYRLFPRNSSMSNTCLTLGVLGAVLLIGRSDEKDDVKCIRLAL